MSLASGKTWKGEEKNLALQVSIDDVDGVLRYKLCNYGLFHIEFSYLMFETHYNDNSFGLPSTFPPSLIFITNHAMCTAPSPRITELDR